MDEIDAALDFKNVSIVANYIKERTKNAQFIIIRCVHGRRACFMGCYIFFLCFLLLVCFSGLCTLAVFGGVLLLRGTDDGAFGRRTITIAP